jgi:hypothetical protein
MGQLPSGNLLHNELENHHAIFMGKSTISMVIFNNYVNHYQRVPTPANAMGQNPRDPEPHLWEQRNGQRPQRTSAQGVEGHGEMPGTLEDDRHDTRITSI